VKTRSKRKIREISKSQYWQEKLCDTFYGWLAGWENWSFLLSIYALRNSRFPKHLYYRIFLRNNRKEVIFGLNWDLNN
jgi:hypothetical protein